MTLLLHLIYCLSKQFFLWIYDLSHQCQVFIQYDLNFVLVPFRVSRWESRHNAIVILSESFQCNTLGSPNLDQTVKLSQIWITILSLHCQFHAFTVFRKIFNYCLVYFVLNYKFYSSGKIQNSCPQANEWQWIKRVD